MTHLHLVLVGSLFFWPLVGTDPIPGRVAFGVTIMSQNALIGGDWCPSLPMTWLPSPTADQHLAGGILWSSGDLVGLVFVGTLFAQWVRSSMREAVREDRRLDRLEAQAAVRRTAAPLEPEPDR